MVVQLPTADGGRRAIGLLPTVIKIWMRARGAVVRAWRASLKEGYRKEARRAAWMQAAKAEAARSAKRCYGVILVDIMKAFEKVPHHRVAEAAATRGYPLRVLRLSLNKYRMARTIVIDGVCSRTVTAAQGITAGSGFASEELCCLLLYVMDELEEQLPSAVGSLDVDDATLEAEGSRKNVVAQMRNPDSYHRCGAGGTTAYLHQVNCAGHLQTRRCQRNQSFEDRWQDGAKKEEAH